MPSESVSRWPLCTLEYCIYRAFEQDALSDAFSLLDEAVGPYDMVIWRTAFVFW
jgi:hypothetical protein